jgi:hypothetical protein
MVHNKSVRVLLMLLIIFGLAACKHAGSPGKPGSPPNYISSPK